VRDVDLIGKELHYHNTCRCDYMRVLNDQHLTRASTATTTPTMPSKKLNKLKKKTLTSFIFNYQIYTSENHFNWMFDSAASTLWNYLPLNVRAVGANRGRLKAHLFSEAFPP
jgi:hypothetical protein